MTSQGPRVAVTDPLATIRADMFESTKNDGKGGFVHPTFKVNTPGGGSPGRPPFSRQTSAASSFDDAADDFFDEFDWSEDEQEQQAAKEEEKQLQAIALRRRKISPFKIIKWLATTFLGNFILSATLVAPAIVLQYTYRNEGPDSERAKRNYVTDNVQAWLIWAAFNLHVEWWIHLIVELFPRAAIAIVSGVWGSVSQRVLSFVEVFNAIKGYVKLIGYAALSWGSWAIIFNSIYHLYTRTNPETESRAPYLYRIYEVVEFFFFFTLTIAAEKILIKIISIRFHKTAYAERISKITKALKTFDWLKDHRPKDKGTNSPFGFKTPKGLRTPVSFNMPHHGTPLNAPADVLGEPVPSGQATPKAGFFSRKTHAEKRPGDAPTAVPMRNYSEPNTPGAASARSTKSKQTMNAAKQKASQATNLAKKAMVDPTHLLTDDTVGVGLDVNSPAEARRLARTLFRAYRGRHRRTYLVPSDFEVAYKNPEDAKDAFEVFDSDRNGDISMTEMKNTIVEIYKDRRFVAKSLEDTSSALSQLDLIFLFVAMIIVAFEAFAIFNVDVSKTLTTFYTLAIGASFVFKESAQEVFDSIIFLFVTHPFDTGDRICVNESVMVVQKMSLLSCQFLLWDNTQIFINNALLSQMFIMNYRRSGYQWECVKMQVAFDTPWSTLDAVQADVTHWLQTEPDRMFEPSTAIVPQSIDFMRCISVTIGMTHRANYQDWGARWYKRNCFFAAVCYYMRKHGVKYMNSTQPIIYWDPPSYETSEAQKVETFDQDAVINDDFAKLERKPTLTTSGAHKPRTLLGFAPPTDEIEGSALRKRKARRKGLAQQGGEGGGGA
ncbi:uncharacterized protein FA14DRAFT_118645 [Meira miltonrushii]|uniref:EF-hand domain-containing protein n=1 Tax=Meira miltonrushii TaxID=1280837 RepID=A0A316VL48_9BASI|nr:uncharacterized protein FA14DRAFT_118645 [Meira miltonrushii]PWN37798.1 hypothetical protein FA14DRAFT_118645 [Meira miltonrushii]